MSPRKRQITLAAATVAAVAVLALAPTGLGALAGSGNVTDIVQLSTTTSSLPVLSSTATVGSASGAPVTSGGAAFTMTNSGSNVDTFLRYAWGTTPYYGANPLSTAITLRGDANTIADLLWFRQSAITAAGVATASEYFSPLLLENAPTAERASFTSAANACSGWTGTADVDFSATAAGTFTFRYHALASPVDDAPLTSDVFHYCLDTTNTEVYLAKSASFADATRVRSFTTESAAAVLKTYQYEARSGAQANGNLYCLVGVTGSGTTATPQLAQCQKLPYETADETSVKLYALFDPPAFFPAANQGGTITYAIAGTQWNPYASSTTNSA